MVRYGTSVILARVIVVFELAVLRVAYTKGLESGIEASFCGGDAVSDKDGVLVNQISRDL